MHRTLTSTGCSRDFCQAGRATHTDEQRVGENRALENVCEEAVNFLRDLYDEDFFPNEQALQERLQAVYTEILGGTVEGYARENKMRTQIGGNWTQTPQELEFGVQRAWRNARKCIARNHHQELKLCDLRSVTSSIGMAQELIRNTLDAFNDGKVEPTVFVFPPRTVDSRGPMIWNHQILEFAGYEMDDGIILGDPANVGLTKAILELGWTPPQPRGRWDLLPLVTMAEGDTPAMMEIPAPLSTLVHIRHPRYPCFEDLDLNWVAAPALTRLGFDIGGVQYTAAPFIGWFMDAEIAVRNLADSFRYNVLPNIVQAMNLTDGKLQDGIDSFDDLPEYEQLAMLSRAQTELNYAVKWSFNNSGVTMTDSLTASKKWCSFDDKFKKEHGYRLPADPYWIAPPQGSIIPVWHRGGAPNYQPKPMISKHVQDPINAWKREERRRQLSLNTTNPMTICQTVAFTRKEMVVNIEEAEILRSDDEDSVSLTSTLSELKTIAIYFCSAGTIAEKLAKRLHKRIDKLTKVSLNVALSPSVECLNDLQLADMIADKIFLLVVSSSGKGEVPANGSSFIQRTSPSTKIMAGTTFAVFGNGDSRYSATYNGAAETIYRHLQKLGGLALIRGVFRGDIAVEPIPYTAMNAWCNRIELRLNELGNKSLLTDGSLGDPDVGKEVGYELTTFVDDALDRVTEYAKEIHSFEEASIVATKPGQYDSSQRSLNLVLDIGNATYKEANCIQILPLNHPAKVDRVLKAMKLDRTVTLGIPILEPSVDITSFLSQFADLELPFKSSHWLFMNDKTSSSSNYLMGEILGRFVSSFSRTFNMNPIPREQER